MKGRQVVSNLQMAGATVLEHLGDDPVVLVQQIARRLPARVSGTAVRIAAAVAPQTFMAPLAAFLQGNPDSARKLLLGAATADISPRSRLRMADTAVACGFPDVADLLLLEVGTATKGMAEVTARRLWFSGDMSAAVSALDGGNKREKRLQRRLSSEVRVFSGWRPQLQRHPEFRPREKTVLHLLTNSLPHTGSGYAQRSHSILTSQLQLGWNVHAVTRAGYPVNVGRLLSASADVMDGVTYHRILPARMPFGMDARLQLQAEEMLELALRLRPSILHTTTHFVNGLVTAAVAEALGIPWVYEVRGQLADTWASTRDNTATSSERYLQFVAREAEMIQSADLVATIGSVMRAGIRAADSGNREILMLPNAVGEDFLAPPVEPARARTALGLPEGSAVIGTVSSLVEYEGIDDLLRAFALIAPTYPEVYCLIVGDGSAAPSLKVLAAELGLADRVIFPGRVHRSVAHQWHQALDVFVVPRKESSVTRAVTPLKPVEASASARPIAVSDLPALRELVQDGVTGLVFAPDNPASLADALERLIRDGDLRRKLGAAGRQGVLAERTWTANAVATVAAYSGLRRVC